MEETAISIIAQLCSQLHSSKTNDYSMRLLFKFIENEKEKLERLLIHLAVCMYVCVYVGHFLYMTHITIHPSNRYINFCNRTPTILPIPTRPTYVYVYVYVCMYVCRCDSFVY